MRIITHPKFLTLMPKGRKLQFLLILFFIIFNISEINADYTVCDSGNIDFTGTGITEICSGGTMTGSIVGIDNFNGDFVNFEMGYWGNNNNYSNNLNIEENLSFGYFDENKKTIITKLNPQNDNTKVGYWGNVYDFQNPEIDIETSYPVGLFDGSKVTYIKNINPNFDTPTGFLGSYVLPKKKSSGRRNIINQVTYREYFLDIFKQNYYLAVQNGNNSQKDYNIFVTNILDLIINGNELENKIIDENIKNRIKLEIENGEFRKILSKLVLNLKEINNAFEKVESREVRFYIIKFYLDV